MARRNAVRLLLLGLAVLALPGFLAIRALVGSRAEPTLVGSRPSVEQLALEFLDSLRAGDEAKIRQLALSKEQFVEYIWPELPASDPHTNLSADFVWNQMFMRSETALAGTLFRNKGKRYELVSYRFVDGTEDYPSYEVHRDTRLTVRDENGEERELNLFGSVLERDGEFKIFSFVL